MSDEQYREKERKSPLDRLEKIGGAALALGAGAALAYNYGGGKFLSNGITEIENTARDISAEISDKRLDMGELRNVWGKYLGGQGGLIDRVRHSNRSEIELDEADNNSVISSFSKAMKYAVRKGGFLGKLYNDENVKIPMLKDLFDIAGDDETRRDAVSKIADEFSHNFRNVVEYTADAEKKTTYFFKDSFIKDYFKDGIFTEDEQKNILNTLTAHKQANKRDLTDFIEAKKDIASQAIDKLLDIDELENRFGTAQKTNNKDKFFDNLLHDQKMTIGDLLRIRKEAQSGKGSVSNTVIKNADFYLLNSKNEVETHNVLDFIEGMINSSSKDDAERIRNLYVGSSFRVLKDKNGVQGVRSFQKVKKAFDKSLNDFANTVPGKIFKVRDFQLRFNSPNVFYTGFRAADPILATIENQGKNALLTNASYLRIYNKTYRINQQKNMIEHVKELDNTVLMSGRYGSFPRLLKAISGNEDYRLGYNNKYLQFLDVNKTANTNLIRKFFAGIGKFTDKRWARNIPKSLFNNEDITGFYEGVARENKLISQSIGSIDSNTVRKLSSNAKDNSKVYFNLLLKSNEEMLKSLLEMTKNNGVFSQSNTQHINDDLDYYIRSYFRNPDIKKSVMSIVSSHTGIKETKAVTYFDALRREVAKEGILQEVKTKGRGIGNLNSILSLVEKSGLTSEEKKKTLNLANWAVFQKFTGEYASNKPRDAMDMILGAKNAMALFNSDVAEGKMSSSIDFLKQFRSGIKKIAKENSSIFDKGFMNNKDLMHSYALPEYVYMKKGITPLNVLKNLNNKTMQKAFLKQFTAGRKNMNDMTMFTMLPYNSLYRLTGGLSNFGIGFSKDSSQDVLNLAANIMFKRVIPFQIGMKALSYLDFRTKAYTGTSLKGYAANSLANIDLTMRKTADIFGLTGRLKKSRAMNPIARYYFGEEYQDYNERKEWYENGVSPVRKGRFWNFGSMSEHRGGKIQYYEPNYVRRANSDWKDIALYGSVNDKWKYSWLPTPRHPLSTLRRLFNPYYLEKKHYWDRPYPVTGKMFEEETPWGPILNATVGKIMKPQRRMHKRELGRNLIDVRDLIKERNEEIKQRAMNVVVTADNTGNLSVGEYSPLSNPTGNESVLNLKLKNGRVVNSELRGYDYVKSLSDISELNSVKTAPEAQGSTRNGFAGDYTPQTKLGAYTSIGGNVSNAKLSGASRIKIGARKGALLPSLIEQVMPATSYVKNLNEHIKAKAQTIPPNGVVVSETEKQLRRRAYNKYGVNKDELQGLKEASSTKDFLGAARYSVNELLGVYGFMANMAMPGKKKYRLSDASKMNSLSRGFWDEDLGGLGGGFMEIARRFLPHENHNTEKINPLKNTMPDWMPERFQHGDPYTLVQKGEMRLPGKGYETINKLHPDEYGRYGAFDRFKILADIAPSSYEYKLWRNVASKTIKDQTLKKQIKDIKERANKQLSNHDFYPYKFSKDTALQTKSAVISKVLSSRTFKVVGDDHNVYKLAGIDMPGKSKTLIYAGQKIDLKTAKNKYKRYYNDNSVAAVVYSNGKNINQELVNRKIATNDKNDITAAGIRYPFSNTDTKIGHVLELIAHAPIPIIHEKFMKIETSLESFKNEQVYGTPYSTWNHPIRGYILPPLKKAAGRGTMGQVIGLSAWAISRKLSKNGNVPEAVQKSANAAFVLTNPGAAAGALAGYLMKMKTGQMVAKGAQLGAVLQYSAYLGASVQNPIKSMANFALIGNALGRKLYPDGSMNKKATAIGALTGLAISALKNPRFDKEKMFGPYIPKSRRKQRDIEEYFDRLSYMKYMGLYEKASRMAKTHEHIDIKKIIESYEKDVVKREKVQKQLLNYRHLISNIYPEGNSEASKLYNEVDTRLQKLQFPTRIFKGGKYAKSAVAYKEAAESTIYGLKKNATWTQLIRSVPNNQRDYFIEFIKEKDPREQKKIMKYLSPYERKVLQIAWGKKVQKQKSNESYFEHGHNMPISSWTGWKPDVDLDNVKIKVIKNEGLLLSDFGMYDSQTQSEETRKAPAIDMNARYSSIKIASNISAVLRGNGLSGVNVSIEPTSKHGINVIADIARIDTYNIKNAVSSAMSNIF